MNKIVSSSVVCCFAFFCFGGAVSSRISLENNGYSNIVVGISEDISYSRTLANDLTKGLITLFSQGSHALFRATHNRSYLHDITIVVPKSWPTENHYDLATVETFTEADIRVDLPNPSYGDGPYTLQDRGCGEPGRYIHLTPSYILNLNGNSTATFGDPGKTFVHEWAHFRYGTFDEFGDPRDAKFPIAYYNDKHELLPNSCNNKHLKGEFRDRTLLFSPCNFDSSGNPDENCIFLPDKSGSDSTTSIGSFHFLPKVFTFCDSSTENRHNYDAPNKHNAMCDGLSAWEVILMHEDFSKNKNPPIGSNIPEPSIHIVQAKEPTFVLVLDVSLSMKSSDKYLFLAEAVSKWLKYELQLGSAVGIITFSTTATVLHRIVKVENENIRQSLLDKAEQLKDLSKYKLNTCIGCGLKASLESLENYGIHKGGIILLLTDGRESPNLTPTMKGIQANIVSSKVKVVTVAFTDIADPKIEQLAQITGGKSFFINVESQAEALNSAFYEYSTYQMVESTVYVKVYEAQIAVKTNYSGQFTIDDTIGGNVSVDFIYRTPNIIDHISISPGSFIETKDDGVKMIRYSSPSVKAGKYTYNIVLNSAGSEEKILVAVTSQPRSKTAKPITTTCWIGSITDPHLGTLMIVFAEVRQRHNPVVNANVVASVERPDNSHVLLQLFDNGNGDPDVTRNDGIYSRYFTGYSGPGRYSVKAQVDDKGLAAILELGFTASRAMPATPDYFPEVSNLKSRRTGSFSRIASAGSFQIEENSQIVKDLPPGQVRDLMTIVAWTNKTIVLKWTSPGEDLDNGIVSSYDIRMSKSSQTLRKTFLTGIKINSSKTLKPLPAGTPLFFQFQFESASVSSMYYVALKAIDNKGQLSHISNIAQVRFVPTPSSSNSLVPSKILEICIVISFLYMFFNAAVH